MSKAYPPRKTRAESFLGIHFDFHAGDDCTEIGKRVTREMIERIIDQVQPDFLQCDCKGHRGLSSYPTKVGHPAPGFVKDQLRIWREVTAERGVALYLHYSGVWDSEAVKRHPSWARVNERGKRDKNATSVFGQYVDKLLIPQLKELSDDYGVDGMWVDGECWATVPDYGKRVIEAFRAATGIAAIPHTPDDPHYVDYLNFCRDGFRRYLAHYVDALHRHNPQFQIASNWAYTSFMPEPVTVNVDYLSGDYPLQDSVNAARMEARFLANQGKPWDLMAWGFSGRFQEGVWCTKSVAQLQQEAAVVLALGGGFQAYFTQNRDGSIREWTMKLMSEVAKFCRARQAVCHHAKAVPQIAVLNSTAAFYRNCKTLFSPWQGELVPLSGVLNALLDSQYSVEIVSEHHLAGGRLHDYPLIVLPETNYLEPAFRQELLEYVAQGGNLLLIGPAAAALFARELDITLQEQPAVASKWLEQDGWLAGLKGLTQAATLGASAQPFGKLYARDDLASDSQAAAVITPYGKGKIAATLTNMGEGYRKARTAVARTFLAALTRELFPRPLVEVTGSHFVDVIVNRIDGKLAVNLLNTAGPHHDPNIYTFDEIPPIGPLDITIRTGTAPQRVTLEPGGEALAYEFQDGMVKLSLSRLNIHQVIVVE